MHGDAGGVGAIRRATPQADARKNPIAFRVLTHPSCILPAAIGDVRIVPVGDSADDGEASLIACYVPDLAVDIVAPLRAAGYADDAIRALGDVGI